jgi:hypothetical protein
MTDQPDWERIEQLYRAGVLSLREIAAACPGSNHMAIARRAKKLGWTQDLAAKIKAKAEDLVTRQLVTESVTADRAVTDRSVIDANAQAIANVRLGHRTDISRSRKLAIKLLDELESLTDEQGTLKELIAQLKDGDEGEGGSGAEMSDVLALASKMATLPSRTKTMKELGETLKNLITLERQAYSLDATPEGGNSADQSLTISFVKPNGN